MAATRLRNTFQYPADHSDDDDTPRNMDEEEQEKLIRKLQQEDDERNDEYKRFFLVVPSVAAASFIPVLIMSRRISVKLISLLSISSLIATAYVLVYVLNTRTRKSSNDKARDQLKPKQGPIQRYINHLNGALSLLIAIFSFNFKNEGEVHEGFWLLCFLPVVCFAVINLARRLMLSVDMGELEHLRYPYKGA